MEQSKTWSWTREHVFMGGGKLEKNPVHCGDLELTDQGLQIQPNDDYYEGMLPPEAALELARAILARFGK